MRDNLRCSQCNKIIECGNDLYRCCDANVCSPFCGDKRLMSIQKSDPYLVSPSSWNNLNNKKHDVDPFPIYNRYLKHNSSFKLNKKNIFQSNKSESVEFNLSYELNEPDDSDDYYDYDENNTIILISPIINCVKKFALLFS